MTEKNLEDSGLKVLATELGLQMYMTEPTFEPKAVSRQEMETALEKAFLELQAIPLNSSSR